MTLSPGQTLDNRYRVVQLLGQGGFGAVYRAWDTNLNGPCAVKENFDTSPAAQKVNPAVSAGVSAALEKAMRISRAERYEGVAEFL
ncbi:MAG: hypothetical protein AB1894_04535 [Chloroflexota bacterium]